MNSDPVVAEASSTRSVSSPLDSAVPAGPVWEKIAKRLATLLFLGVLFVPGFLYSDDPFNLNLYTRYMALALFALSVDLVWGYTGLLSLGQGLFFGIGAYAVGYALIQQGAESRGGTMPEFMAQNRIESVPTLIAMMHDTWAGLVVALVLPTLIALAIGSAMFLRRIKGVYFSLFTQAVLLAVFILVSNQRTYTGGIDGLTSQAKFNLFGVSINEDSAELFFIVTGILVGCFVILSVLLEGKFGKVLTAIRDNEFRVTAIGYNTAMYKIFCYSLAGLLAGLAGALYDAANRSAGPQWFSIAFSIEVVIYVAVGGRGTLVGAILGTVLVNVLRTYLNDNTTDFSNFLKWSYNSIAQMAGSTSRFTEPAKLWPIWLGSMFVIVVLFLPDGILGLLNKITARVLRPSNANPNGSN
jgi:urea transport system permease protein